MAFALCTPGTLIIWRLWRVDPSAYEPPDMYDIQMRGILNSFLLNRVLTALTLCNRYVLALAAFLSLHAVVPVSAQDTIPRALQQRMGQRLAPAEILRRLRESGLTREQVRERLRQAGYDPTLADRYFDQLERGDTANAATTSNRLVQPVPLPSGSLIAGLRRIGVLLPGDSIVTDSLQARADSARARRRPVRDSLNPQIFGRELFSATTTQFQPMLQGPVDPDYRLGPGDEITLVVTGDVELIYDLVVAREGFIVIPSVGRVTVAGLTLEQTKARLNQRLAGVYSGIARGSTQFDLSVGELRRIMVWAIGEVEFPGSYPVTGGATVFNVLYLAGGPNTNGSFRSIQVKRGDRVVREVDLYDHLLRGDKSGDIRLEQGDVVFVPVLDRRVTIKGSVRRPAIFELKPNETLADVIRFSGGPEAEAAVERIQIDRILPPGQRTPGKERTLLETSMNALRTTAVPVEDGDVISIFTISSERRNRVTITGDVHTPGDFEWRAGMTALDLVNAAQGLLPSAYAQAAHVMRLNMRDSTRTLVPIVFDNPASRDYAGAVRLEDLDEIVVFSRSRLVNPQQVEIFGLVKEQGAYPFTRNMSVQDLVLQSGGFKEGALEQQAEVARRVRKNDDGDSLAVVYRAPLRIVLTDTTAQGTAPAFLLQPGDQVFIRQLPGYAPLSTVEVTGEVTYPGPYTVESKSERLSNLIRRAGGLTKEAYARGFRLFRDGKAVGIDLPRAMQRPGTADDIIIEPGDRLEIPEYDPLVLITGAVVFESKARFERNLDVEDYVRRAGGATEDGDKGRISVRYPNGELRTTERKLGIRRYPRVEPGSTIIVPRRATSSRTNWDQVLSRSLTVLSTFATLLIAYSAVKQE
jgi:polysaccharide export outer membrane protein